MKKVLISFAAFLLMGGMELGMSGYAQEVAVKGSIGGTVFDATGAVISGAKVTVIGPTGTRDVTTDADGNFTVLNLVPGRYIVKAEMSGFKAAEVKDIEVFVGRRTMVRITLEPGQITEVIEVTGGEIGVDTTSTAIGANLNDTLYQQIPLQRNVANLFYLAAGVNDSDRGGFSNPSISGGSALENLYIADGVNITDSAFGGLGTFSRVYGTLGTGIVASFVKEVQIRSGGYEPQYGRATGGIVNIITKSGSREFHGALFGFFQPRQFEATRKQPDDFRTNKVGKTLHQGAFDGGVEISGYIPKMADKWTWFGSFNPSTPRDYVLGADGSGLKRLLGEFTIHRLVYNYAFKTVYNISSKHSVEYSIFGDPTRTNRAPFRTLNIDNTSATSKLAYGTRNMNWRYNGTFTPTWFLSTSFAYGFNYFREKDFDPVYQIVDITQTAGLPGQRGQFVAQGLGFFEPTNSKHFTYSADSSKRYRFLGQAHTFDLGFQYERSRYSGSRERSGPRFPIPAANATGTPVTALGVPAKDVGQLTNAQFRLRTSPASCTLCPLMDIPGLGLTPVHLQQIRGEFGPTTFNTHANYYAAYVMDSWNITSRLLLKLGLRWEENHLFGEDLNYAFTDAWSPRIGVVFDPIGDRKTKAYANFGRYFYNIPLDLAERSLTNERDFLNARWAPDFVVDSQGRRIVKLNQFGTVIPVLDAAHLLNRATGGIATGFLVSEQSTTGIAPGTKPQYEDEFVVGFEREFPRGVVFSVRYIDRRIKRIVEDTGGISPEAASAGIEQIFQIGNVSSSTDLFTNPIAHRIPSLNQLHPSCDPNLATEVVDTFGNSLGFVCFEPKGRNGQPAGVAIPDGIPDGFPDPVRNYQAVEIEVNKRFGQNWMVLANWRIARLFGNFEGAFRNDNGQTDPSISSLFDFTSGDFGLLGDQFKPGHLNTDRRHIVNFYASYVLDRTKLRDLTMGVGLRFASGQPINDLKAHPVYLNAGEVPVNGRGSLGRHPVSGNVDLHFDYPFKLTERMKLRVGWDFFNIANSRRVLRFNQFEDLQFGVINRDFKTPERFQSPFSTRGSLRLEF
jgi:hypothetical protein